MSRGIIVNNPGAVETVVNLTTIRALDGDTIYTGSVYLSDISEDEIDAVKSAIEAYSPTPGPGPTPPTPGPEIEPYYVPGWFEHQDGNWVLVKAGQTWLIQYSDNGSSWTDASYTASDVDTWFNMDNEAFRQAKYIRRRDAGSSGDNKILAMNLDMPNYLSPAGQSTSGSYLNIWQDSSIVNVKIKIDHFEVYLLMNSLQYAFYTNSQMTTCEIEQYRPEKMTASTMAYMFQYCYSLQSLDLSSWNVEKVTNMSSMFQYCYSLQSLDLSNWNVKKVTNMNNIFSDCWSLQSIKGLEDWNVSNVTNMSYVFAQCYSLQSLDLSNWNVSNVTGMPGMFIGCQSLQSLNLSNWNIENVIDMYDTFWYCVSLKDFKIKSKPKTIELPFNSSNYVLSNDSLQWMADNFPDISGDDTYTNVMISGFSDYVKARYMWNYFYNTMMTKGYFRSKTKTMSYIDGHWEGDTISTDSGDVYPTYYIWGMIEIPDLTSDNTEIYNISLHDGNMVQVSNRAKIGDVINITNLIDDMSNLQVTGGGLADRIPYNETISVRYNNYGMWEIIS